MKTTVKRIASLAAAAAVTVGLISIAAAPAASAAPTAKMPLKVTAPVIGTVTFKVTAATLADPQAFLKCAVPVAIDKAPALKKATKKTRAKMLNRIAATCTARLTAEPVPAAGSAPAQQVTAEPVPATGVTGGQQVTGSKGYTAVYEQWIALGASTTAAANWAEAGVSPEQTTWRPYTAKPLTAADLTAAAIANRPADYVPPATDKVYNCYDNQ